MIKTPRGLRWLQADRRTGVRLHAACDTTSYENGKHAGWRETFGVPASAGFICIGRLKAELQTDPAPGAHFQVRRHAAGGATTHENGGNRTIPEYLSSVLSVRSVAVFSGLSVAFSGQPRTDTDKTQIVPECKIHLGMSPSETGSAALSLKMELGPVCAKRLGLRQSPAAFATITQTKAPEAWRTP